jgi:segregation and condensation protein B
LKDLPAMPDILAEDAARHPQQLSLLDAEEDKVEMPVENETVPDRE